MPAPAGDTAQERLQSLRGLIRNITGEIATLRGCAPARPAEITPPQLLRIELPPQEPPPPGPVPPRGSGVGRRLVWAAAAAALLGGLFIVESGLWDRGRDHEIPTSHPTGLAWRGDELWVSDWYERSVYQMRLGPDGLKVERRYSLPTTHVMALAVSEHHVYLADYGAKQIQRRRLDLDLTLEKAVASPGRNPSALFCDGKYLWSADKVTRRLYQHALDDALTVLAEYPLGYAAVALHVDSTGLWSAGEEPRLFYRHGPPRGLELEGAYGLPEVLSGRAPISGMAWRGRRLWVALDGVNKISERPAIKLQRRN